MSNHKRHNGLFGVNKRMICFPRNGSGSALRDTTEYVDHSVLA